MTLSTAARPRRVWDLVLSIVLLLLLAVLGAVASFFAVFLVFVSDSCGSSSTCDTGRMGLGFVVAFIGVWVPFLPVLVLTIVQLVRRRIAFWLPLVGAALVVAIWAEGAVLAVVSLRPSP